jgi:hypothetical protein
MKAILLTWELGGGQGHLTKLVPLVRVLHERGHRVIAALKDLSRAESAFAALDVEYLQGPSKTRFSDKTIPVPRSFAQILHDKGYCDIDELWAMASAWRNLFALVKPDLIVFEYSPTALLAACGLALKKALLGTGFCCPVDEYPLRDLRPWIRDDARQRLQRDEDAVLRNMNAVLERWRQPPLERVAHLFRDVDEIFLATVPELDHYPGRGGALANGQALTPCPSPGGRGEIRYWGAWPNMGGCAPQWPEGEGKKVFAYLKGFPALPRLLQRLCELRCPTIVYGDGVGAALRERFQAPTLRYEIQRLDLAQVGRSCDLAILNGTHGTSFSMLMAGKPILQLPLVLEQVLLSYAVGRLGAAIVVMPDRPDAVVVALERMLCTPAYAQAAQAFAAKYAGYDPQRQIAAVIGRVEELLVSSAQAK